MGKLEIEVIRAELTRDTDMIGSMDCYAKIKTSDGTKYKTKILSGCGKKPQWNETLIIPDWDGKALTIQVVDADVGPNDIVGIATINPDDFKLPRFNLDHKGTSAGDIYLCISKEEKKDDDKKKEKKGSDSEDDKKSKKDKKDKKGKKDKKDKKEKKDKKKD